MEQTGLDRERNIFAACVDLPAEDRARYLDVICGEDGDLRERIEHLLSAHDLRTGELSALARIPPPNSELPERIGPYLITSLAGEGGMGTVYEAEQMEPVQRRVALKVMHWGGPPGSNERFAAELQTLALMEHPNVAKVYDAGHTASGQPYLVMELVRGDSLTDYCEKRRLALHDRVALFLQLCRAVEHAHQKGVIHRDLKPANVLVHDTEAHPVVKVIDFGIARAAWNAVTDVRLTMTGAALGTPAYMSPEQARGERDVDTRSDVYALGVILYELIAKRLPADPEAVGYARFLSQLGCGEIRIQAPRTDPGGDAGDLGWIALRALEWDREQRYPSAAMLVDDLERYLANRPVAARPPTLTYRFGKFVRRNRLAVAAGVIVVLAVAAGGAAAGAGYVRALRAEAQAREEAAAAAEVSRFLVDTFRVNDPGETRGRTVTARELLDNASRLVESSFSAQPGIRQRLLTSLSSAQASLGLYKEAAVLAEKAALNIPESGRESLLDAAALQALAAARQRQNQFEQARVAAARAADIRKRILGPRHPLVADALIVQGDVLANTDRFDQSIPLHTEAVSIRAAGLGEGHVDTGRALVRLGFSYARRAREGDFAKAAEVEQRALAIFNATLGSEHPEYASCLEQLAFVEKDNAKALLLHERVLAIRLKVFGPDHIRTSDSYLSVARALNATGQFANARQHAQKAMALREQQFGPDSVQINNVLSAIAAAEAGLHGYGSALPYLRRYLEIARKNFGSDHSTTRLGQINVGKALLGVRRYDEALPYLREGIRGGFSLRWEDAWYDPVRKDPRYLGLLAEEQRLRKEKPMESSRRIKIP